MLNAGLALSIALLLGRLSGLVRELQLANAFGVSRQADVAVLLLTLPDMLVGLVLAGGLSAALVPRFRQLPPVAAAMLFRRAAGWAMLAFGVVAVLLAGAPGILLGVLAPGIADPSRETGLLAPALVALALPLSAASGVVAAYLNANDRYFVAGLGTLVFNIGVIAALHFVEPDRAGSPLTILGAGIAAGALVRLSLTMLVVPKSAWTGQAAEPVSDPGLLSAFAAGVVATGLMLLAPVLIRAGASLLSDGAVASFNYAQKLTELPVGILITTISTVALTTFSSLAAAGDSTVLASAGRERARRSITVAIIVTAFGVAFARPLVAFLLGRGAMDADALDRVATLTQISLFQVIFVAVSSVAIAYLNAQLRTGLVLRLTGYCLVALPILALPGILLKSDQALMGAVVLFQALSAVLLGRAAGFRLTGAMGLIDLRLGTVAVIAVGVAWLTAEAAAILASPAWLALGIGGVGFGVVMLGAGWRLK